VLFRSAETAASAPIIRIAFSFMPTLLPRELTSPPARHSVASAGNNRAMTPQHRRNIPPNGTRLTRLPRLP